MLFAAVLCVLIAEQIILQLEKPQNFRDCISRVLPQKRLCFLYYFGGILTPPLPKIFELHRTIELLNYLNYIE